MENHSKAKASFNQESDKPRLEKETSYEKAEKEWNSKILKITLKINDQYPELSKYLEEMPVTVPVENNPEISLENLRNYYESLNVLLEKYIKEQQ